MGADAKYIVELELKRLGDFSLDPINKKASTLDDRVRDIKAGFVDLAGRAGGVVGVMDSLVSTTAKVGAGFVAIGAGAAIAAVKESVIGLNAQLESTTMSLGAIFGAQGVTKTVPEGMRLAQDTIAKMRVDAQKLPGEFEDLMQIFTLGATPAFQNGLSVEKWRGLSSQAMAAAKATGMDMGQAARELSHLLEGRAGAQNVFGTKLGFSGDEAKKFNKLGVDERVAALTQALGKYQGAIDLFGSSWDAQTSTLTDNIKQFGLVLGKETFEEIKKTLADVNAWFDANRQEINAWASDIGFRLREAFDWGKQKVLEWGPIIIDFATVAYDRLSSFWKEIEPSVQKIAQYLKEALEDPNGTIDKMIVLAKLYVGLKAAQGIGGMLSGGAGVASAGGSIIGAVGDAAAAAKLAGEAGGLGKALAGLAVPALAGAAALAGLAAAGVALTWAWTQWEHYQRVKEEGERKLQDASESLSSKILDTSEAVTSLAEGHRNSMLTLEMFETQVEETAAALDPTNAALLRLAAADVAAFAFNAYGGRITDAITEKSNTDQGDENFHRFMQRERDAEAAKAANGKHKHPGGGGGTSIQKVEIVVTSNQNPDRIATMVLGKIEQLGRRRTASPYQPNYSRLDR